MLRRIVGKSPWVLEINSPSGFPRSSEAGMYAPLTKEGNAKEAFQTPN